MPKIWIAVTVVVAIATLGGAILFSSSPVPETALKPITQPSPEPAKVASRNQEPEKQAQPPPVVEAPKPPAPAPAPAPQQPAPAQAPAPAPVPQQPAPVPPPQQVVKGNFAIDLERFTDIAKRSYTSTISVKVNPTPDFESEITFFAADVPDGVTITFSPEKILGSQRGTTAKIEVSDKAKSGTYTILIGGKNGPIANTQRYVLEILDNLIIIEGFQFPAKYTIKKGETVVWLNTDRGDQYDPGAHTITSDAGKFDSALVYAGQTFSLTLRELGTYKYYCRPHPYMIGSIEVLP
ncbi:MAG: hypothetical protein HYU02_09045 [Thaumarchaeota archaeon]|nr:hypothetical protein [Nitrososphaerota archaeon]